MASSFPILTRRSEHNRGVKRFLVIFRFHPGKKATSRLLARADQLWHFIKIYNLHPVCQRAIAWLIVRGNIHQEGRAGIHCGCLPERKTPKQSIMDEFSRWQSGGAGGERMLKTVCPSCESYDFKRLFRSSWVLPVVYTTWESSWSWKHIFCIYIHTHICTWRRICGGQ